MAVSREQLIFDVLANTDRAGSDIVTFGRKVGAASDDVMALAKRLDELSRKSATARVGIDGDKDAQVRLDKLDLKMAQIGNKVMRPDVTVEGAARAAVELAGLDLELDKIGTKGGTAAEATSAMSGLSVSGMGALIGAGAVLSPMLVTLGVGLGGVATAAYGAAKPIEEAAKKTGGLQANLAKLNPEQQQVAHGLLGLGAQFGSFEKDLQPQMLGLFSDGLRLASHLMADAEPVARATASALGGMLGAAGKEFQSGEWKAFFGWMAAQAGPDVKQLSDLFVGLLHDLPPLVQGLQPLASGLIGVATDATKVISVTSQLHVSLPILGATIGAFAGGPIGALIGGLTGVSLELSKMHTSVDATIPSWTKSGDATAAAIASLNAYGPQVAKYIEWLHQSDQAGNNTIDVQKQFAAANSAAALALQNAGLQAILAGRRLLAGAMGMHEMNTQAYLAISPTDHLGKVASAAGDAGWYLSKATSASSTGVLHLGSVTENTVTSTGHFTKVAKPLTVTLYDWATNASQAAIQTADMAKAVNALNTAQAKALGNLVTYSGDILTTANDAVGLRKALAASGNQIGTHTAAQRASFQAANTFITDLGNQAQAAIASGKGVDAASRAISSNLPLLDSAKSKSRLYWQEVQTLTSWLHKLQDLKNIREVVVVTGTGSWTMHNPANQSLPGGFPGGVGAASGLFVRGGTPGRDSVLVSAMPGELIVPTNLVSAGAVDHLRGHIPGFASGGFVPSYSGSVPGLQPWITNNTNAQIHAFGQSMANSLLSAMRAAAASGGVGGAGVTRWAPLVLRVLAMLGQPSGDLGVVLRQMNTESGGNPMAINLTDSNARMGDPSRGLMQTIMSTFLAYAGPFASRGIYDPEANIYAGLNYAIHRYGAGWTSVLGQGHGYDSGGWLHPGVTLAVNNTGKPERVLAPGQSALTSGRSLVHIENQNIYNSTDEAVLAQKLSFAITAAGLGS